MNSEWDIIGENLKHKLHLMDRWYQLILNMIKRANIKIQKNSSILEVGCGVGGFCFWLRSKCKNVMGLDIAKMRINTANKLGKSLGKKTNFIVGDALSLPFKDESFDITVCSETLEHVPDYLRAFNELVRVTKRGGNLIITVPNYINMTRLYIPLELLWRITGKMGQPADFHRFNIFVLDRIFKRKDLKIVIKQGISLISMHQLLPSLRSLEKRLDKPHKKLTPLCINIGVIAQKL